MGNPAGKNMQAQFQLDDILTHPNVKYSEVIKAIFASTLLKVEGLIFVQTAHLKVFRL